MNADNSASPNQSNVEILWAGAPNGYLNISVRLGTFFGLTNDESQLVAHEVMDNSELVDCSIQIETGDIIAVYDVSPAHWCDYAHSMFKRVMRYIAIHPEKWDLRDKEGSRMYMRIDGEGIEQSAPRRLN